MARITKPLSAREVSEAKPKDKERRRNLTRGTFPDLFLA